MLIGTMEIYTAILVLFVVVVIEAIILSKRLTNKLMEWKIFYCVLFSNIVSTLLGLLGLVTWIWDIIRVWIKEILGLPQEFASIYFGVLFIIIAFILTLPFEVLTNIIILRKDYRTRAILKTTLLANSLTYLLLGTIMITLTL